MSTRFLPHRFAVFLIGCALSFSSVATRAQTSNDNPFNVNATQNIVIGEAAPTSASGLETPTPTFSPTSTPTPQETPTTTPTPIASATPVPTPDASFATSKNRPMNAVSLRVLAERMKLPLPLPDAHIVVAKAQRRLELWSGKRLVKTYRVALGANPVGAKQRQHDSRTPEGHFRICTRNASTSAFHIFLGLSYPDVPDAARGVNSGAISWREYALIQRKLASRGAPLWEKRLGGWVGIHGGTGSPFARKQTQKRGRNDWTAGCIALTDMEIEEIYAATKMGTSVWVKP